MSLGVFRFFSTCLTPLISPVGLEPAVKDSHHVEVTVACTASLPGRVTRPRDTVQDTQLSHCPVQSACLAHGEPGGTRLHARDRGTGDHGGSLPPGKEQKHRCPVGRTNALTAGNECDARRDLRLLCVLCGNVSVRVGSFKHSLVFPTIFYREGLNAMSEFVREGGAGEAGGLGSG